METVEASPAASVDGVQEPFIETVEDFPGVEVEQAQKPTPLQLP